MKPKGINISELNPQLADKLYESAKKEAIVLMINYLLSHPYANIDETVEFVLSQNITNETENFRIYLYSIFQECLDDIQHIFDYEMEMDF